MNQVQHRRARATERVFRVSLPELMEITEGLVEAEKAESLANTAFSLLKSVKEEAPTHLMGRMKKTIKAGAIYIAQFYDKSVTTRITQGRVADSLRVSVPSMRKMSKDIVSVLKLKSPFDTHVRRHFPTRGVHFPPSEFFGEYPHDTVKDLHFPPPRFFALPITEGHFTQAIFAMAVVLTLAGMGFMASTGDGLSNGEW